MRVHCRTATLSGLLVLLTLSSPIAARGQPRIVVDGSTGTAPLVEALGKAFTARSGIAIEIGKGLGTRARLDALAGGKIDIAMASHGVKIEEVTARGMTVHPIAKTAVVFAVQSSAKVSDVSEAQVCAIYEGAHANWKELGGGDVGVVAHIRPESEVDTEVIRDGVGCLKTMRFPAAVRVMARSGDMASALAATPGAFGVTSATVAEQSKNRLNLLSLGGIAPSEANVTSGRYRLTRDAFLVTREASAPVRSFIDFIRSPEGAAVIRANGAIAVR
jgi:phosphate transport system substrate-binding protein